MKLRYKCLILDHDDTVINSTGYMHYPSFRKTLELMRPEISMSLEEFYLHCFDPGFDDLIVNKLKLNDEERKVQFEQWLNDTRDIVPVFFEGVAEFLTAYKKAGGILTVVSHSDSEQIKKHYIEKTGFSPDLVFGWDPDPVKRKPAPYPVEMILESFDLLPGEALMVDDLKPGLDMARKTGVQFAYPGWTHHVVSIVEFMKKEADYFLESVNDLEKLVFSGSESISMDN